MFDFFRSKKNLDDEENAAQDKNSSRRVTDQNNNKKSKSDNRSSQMSNKGLLSPQTAATNATDASATSSRRLEPEEMEHEQVDEKDLKWYQGGVRKKYLPVIKWVGRIGFIAKGVVYGCIGVLTLTNLSGAWTPNGSEGNESPQGAFLLLGGIPSVGRTILIVMACGLCLYIIWRMWEAITGQGSDATFSRKKNFFRYRLSPFVSGLVYTAYAYYVIQMIFKTEEEQQNLASSKTFPASWSDSTIGKAGLGVLGVAFAIAFVTQMINAITGNFIKDLKTSEPGTNKLLAFSLHLLGRIGFGGRAALFGTMSGFFWDSLAQQNESGDKNMVAAAIGKLATTGGGRFFMGHLGVTLVMYALFAVLNAYFKYFPTPPPSRHNALTGEEVHPEISDSESESSSSKIEGRESQVAPTGKFFGKSSKKNVSNNGDYNEKDQYDNKPKQSFFARHFPFMRRSRQEDPEKAVGDQPRRY